MNVHHYSVNSMGFGTPSILEKVDDNNSPMAHASSDRAVAIDIPLSSAGTITQQNSGELIPFSPLFPTSVLEPLPHLIPKLLLIGLMFGIR